VIAYASKAFTSTQRVYCTTYKELLAVVTAVKHFRHYLLGRHFKIRTDHGSLRWLTNFKEVEGMVGRWLAQLSPFDFDIEHRKGVSHGNADGLSRRPVVPCQKPCKRPDCPDCSRLVGQVQSESKEYLCCLARPLYSRGPKCSCWLPKRPSGDPEYTIAVVESVEGPGTSTNWMNSWSPEELAAFQQADVNVRLVAEWKAQQVSRPQGTVLNGHNTVVRGLCSVWDSLELRDGVLYRAWALNMTRPNYSCNM